MIDVSATLRGLDSLSRQAELAAATATRKAAEQVARRMALAAPRRSGALASSMRVEGPQKIGPGTWASRVGPTVIYGRRIELGYHGTDARGRSYHQRGHDFFRPAVRDELAVYAGMLAEEWGSAIEGRGFRGRVNRG